MATWNFLAETLPWIFRPSARSIHKRESVCRLRPELLEDRIVPSSLLGLNITSGDWAAAVPDGDDFDVSVIGHWDPYGLRGVVHGDFDGDGEDDVAGWNNLGYWLVGRAGANKILQTQVWLQDWPRNWHWPATLVGDFDGDGMDDIALFANSGAWWVARSTGSEFEITRWDQPGDWRGGVWKDWEVGDFNDDGKDDIAGLTNQGAWQVGLSTGTALQPAVWLPNQSWPVAKLQAVVAGDFNGDGKTDLAGFLNNREVVVATSEGDSLASTVWGGRPATSLPPKWRHAGDFNGDGKDDVVALDRLGNTWLFISDGAAFTTLAVVPYPAIKDPAARLNTGDFNNDGKDDVAILTSSGTWLVGTFDGAAITYSRWGAFGPGKWVATFAAGVREQDLRVNHHSLLRSWSSLYLVTSQDIARLRLDPSYFATIYQTYQYQVRARLGPTFRGLNDQAIAFALATMVAYEAAPYRGLGDPEGYFRPPRSLELKDLLAARKLVCDEYCYLAVELYRVAMPLADDPDTTIHITGFASGPFGNHAQLIFESGGTSLLCDPNLGMVVRTSWSFIRRGSHVASSSIAQLVYRVESTTYMQAAMASFRQAVYDALIGGLYPQANWLYYRDLSNWT